MEIIIQKEENNINLYDISLITESDIEQILKIMISFWLEEGDFSRKTLKSVINEGLSFSIKIKDEIIGFCLLKREVINDGYIFAICVKKDYQHKGLGYKILDYCINNAKKVQVINNFYLHVSMNNEYAINLYKKCGFKIQKKIKNYYHSKKNPESNPAYLMVLKK